MVDLALETVCHDPRLTSRQIPAPRYYLKDEGMKYTFTPKEFREKKQSEFEWGDVIDVGRYEIYPHKNLVKLYGSINNQYPNYIEEFFMDVPEPLKYTEIKENKQPVNKAYLPGGHAKRSAKNRTSWKHQRIAAAAQAYQLEIIETYSKGSWRHCSACGRPYSLKLRPNMNWKKHPRICTECYITRQS